MSEFFGVPVPFILFGLTLLGVALLHHRTLQVALTGLSVILAHALIFGGLDLVAHMRHEWVTLANLLGLLIGFTILADCFHRSKAPELLPRFLPGGYWGAFSLLVLIFILSSFLDNIAAAMIGGRSRRRSSSGRCTLDILRRSWPRRTPEARAASSATPRPQ